MVSLRDEKWYFSASKSSYKGCMPRKAGAGVPDRPADTFYKKWLHFEKKGAILQKDALMKTESV